MKIDRILKWFFPKEDIFFNLFDRSILEVQKASLELTRLEKVSRWDEVPDLAEKIHAIEHVGDDLIYEVMTKLHSTFVTPIDRLDITDLSTAIDDILDLIDDAARRVVIYKIAPVPKGFGEMSHHIHEAVGVLKGGVELLRDLSKGETIRKISKQVHEIESRGDAVYYRCLKEVYSDEKDPIRIMQLKEILEDLESALDKCEDAANILERIVLQNG
jgi:predicted phosphate transport protein (TIGR00153 family)